MRDIFLKEKALEACDLLDASEQEAVEAVIFTFMDERIPLVGPEDRAVTHGSSIMGRPVPGTDLLVYYVPAGPDVHVINVVRR